jgi:glucose-1-phosphate cytidylyltransferase
MKAVILAGGLGTRLAEETIVRPKPMVEVGGLPMLVHIMRIYARYGFKDFVIALGYKGEIIKDYFLNYHLRTGDLAVSLASGKADFAARVRDDWTVRMFDTGDDTLTGGRLHRLEHCLRPEGTFTLTYGDGVCDLDISALLAFHRRHGKLATVTAVRPPARFGAIVMDNDRVVDFHEKPQSSEGWINGGFFVFEPDVFDYLSGDRTVLEGEPLERLARDGQLMAYRHPGFWHCMDTIRDRDALNDLWRSGNAPWASDVPRSPASG